MDIKYTVVKIMIAIKIWAVCPHVVQLFWLLFFGSGVTYVRHNGFFWTTTVASLGPVFW